MRTFKGKKINHEYVSAMISMTVKYWYKIGMGVGVWASETHGCGKPQKHRKNKKTTKKE